LGGNRLNTKKYEYDAGSENPPFENRIEEIGTATFLVITIKVKRSSRHYANYTISKVLF
jgi:hypothetical protein